MVPIGCRNAASLRPAPPIAGFTLVELVVVCVILGVLGAIALPRFIDTAGEARFSKMSYMYSSFHTGTQLAHSFWTARGQLPAGVMTVQGQLVPIAHHWPTPIGALNMLNAGNPPPFVPILSATELEIHESAERPQCRFIYRPPIADGTGPEYVNEVTRANCAN
ncbi:MAG: type II secretion system protein [Proteobacteria bacterium]|nr:type II secretion system protein [Burkholderiales bacterium]